jgi:hypothetical protein
MKGLLAYILLRNGELSISYISKCVDLEQANPDEADKVLPRSRVAYEGDVYGLSTALSHPQRI